MTTADKQSQSPVQPVQSPKHYAKASDMPKAEWDALSRDMAQAMVDSLNEQFGPKAEQPAQK